MPITSLWLEEHPFEIKDTLSRYSTKNFLLNNVSKQVIHSFCKKNKLSWQMLMHAGWGLLLNRFSSSDHVTFGSGVATSKNGCIKLTRPIIAIQSILSTKFNVNHFLIVLQEMLIDLDQKICRINILTKNEKLLLANWGHPKQHTTIPLLSLCPHEAFALQAQQHPKQIAIQYEQLVITYDNLDQAANSLAQLLLKKGVKGGDRISALRSEEH